MKNKLKKYYINNLTVVIILGQVLAYTGIKAGLLNYSDLYINYQYILSGEFWRIFTILFIPPRTSIIMSILSWYILYLMGSNLETYWGHKFYNLYILVALVLTNIVSYFFHFSIGTNYYLQGSIFLAFAFLNPEFQIRLFFILPIKIKWIAILTWLLYLYSAVFGGIGTRILLLASISNFFIFFSKDIYNKIKYRSRGIKQNIEKKQCEKTPLHICSICSRDDKSHPYLEFRYCSKCNPEKCFCEDHIKDHVHKE